MKILFIVLSDIHMREDQKIDKRYVSSISDALNSLGDFNDVCVIMSGDLAFSGQHNEYCKVGCLFGQISDMLRRKLDSNKIIKFFIVPGNHDINFNNISRNRIDILKLQKEGLLDYEIENELKCFSNFYIFANKNKCFINHKILDKKFYQTEDITIQINLLNSELFATFRDNHGDDDKGIHYIPDSELTHLKKSPFAKYCITIMHRSPEWFSWQSIDKIKTKIYKNTNILICGHEHTNDIHSIIKEESNMFSVHTGMFDLKENILSFNTILIDTNVNTCSIKEFQYDSQFNMFTKTSELMDTISQIEIDERLKPNRNFHSDFLKVNNFNLEDIFVFPDIEIINDRNRENTIIKSLDDFFELIKQNNKNIYVEGDNQSGKTTLAKILYETAIKKKFVPLYLDMNDILLKRKYEKEIRDAFSEQYDYDAKDYEKFIQTDKQDKLVIIDNFDRVQDNKVHYFISELKNNFGIIIYLFRQTNKVDFIEQLKQNLSDTDNSVRMKILPFYLKKRRELINKMLECSTIKIDDINQQTNYINNFISDQIRIFSLNPNFISMYVLYYINNINTIDVQNNIFNKVFESSLVRSLQRYVANEDIEEYFSILENLAYRTHFNRIYPISMQEISEIISQYNDEYFMNIDVSKFCNNIVKSNIIEEIDENQYRFVNNSFLAYFVASSLNKIITNEQRLDELKQVCKSICFNINGEILLFLSYLTKNVQILYFIFEQATNCMEEWKEFDLLKNDIRFLNERISYEVVDLPTEIEKDKHEQSIEEQEKKVVRNLEIKTKSIYDDYDEKIIGTKSYHINQSIKYLELVSKILPNFNHTLKKDIKINIVKGLYAFPNKIAQEVLSEVDKHFNEVIDDIIKYLKENNITKFSKDDIVKNIQTEAKYFILNLFDMTARLSTNAKTIKILDSAEMKNVNYEIINIMMNENLGNFVAFTKKADVLYDKSKNLFVKSMIKIIIRKHFLCNKNLKQIGYVQSVANKYFGNNRKYLK